MLKVRIQLCYVLFRDESFAIITAHPLSFWCIMAPSTQIYLIFLVPDPILFWLTHITFHWYVICPVSLCS